MAPLPSLSTSLIIARTSSPRTFFPRAAKHSCRARARARVRVRVKINERVRLRLRLRLG